MIARVSTSGSGRWRISAGQSGEVAIVCGSSALRRNRGCMYCFVIQLYFRSADIGLSRCGRGYYGVRVSFSSVCYQVFVNVIRNMIRSMRAARLFECLK